MGNKLAAEIIRQNQHVIRKLQDRKAQQERESREIERMMRDNRMQGV